MRYSSTELAGALTCIATPEPERAPRHPRRLLLLDSLMSGRRTWGADAAEASDYRNLTCQADGASRHDVEQLNGHLDVEVATTAPVAWNSGAVAVFNGFVTAARQSMED